MYPRLDAPTLEELSSFTLGSYVKLLKYLNQTYRIVPFCRTPSPDKRGPYLILRHDIDISLPAALRMAQIERDLNVKSTYFVLFSSSFYNVFEGENVNIIREISKLGHEIGLHYHPAQFKIYRQKPIDTLEVEIKLLEHLLGKKVYSISRHGGWDRDPFAGIKKYINANHPYYRGDLFVHESGRAWTTLEELINLLNNPYKRTQLLIHPENWQEDKVDRIKLLERHIQNLQSKISWLRKENLEYFEKDPLIANYDKLIQKNSAGQSQIMKNELIFQNQKRFRQALKYYGDLSRYYLVNTVLGWKVHKVKARILKIFG